MRLQSIYNRRAVTGRSCREEWPVSVMQCLWVWELREKMFKQRAGRCRAICRAKSPNWVCAANFAVQWTWISKCSLIENFLMRGPSGRRSCVWLTASPKEKLLVESHKTQSGEYILGGEASRRSVPKSHDVHALWTDVNNIVLRIFELMIMTKVF